VFLLCPRLIEEVLDAWFEGCLPDWNLYSMELKEHRAVQAGVGWPIGRRRIGNRCNGPNLSTRTTTIGGLPKEFHEEFRGKIRTSRDASPGHMGYTTQIRPARLPERIASYWHDSVCHVGTTRQQSMLISHKR
jgi:hypothetical protein